MKWVPGSEFASDCAQERGCLNAVVVKVLNSLFANDTTEVRDKEEEVQVVTEVLDFGANALRGVRMLDSWMGQKEDVSNRLAKAGRAWFKAKQRLVGSKSSGNMCGT